MKVFEAMNCHDDCGPSVTSTYGLFFKRADAYAEIRRHRREFHISALESFMTACTDWSREKHDYVASLPFRGPLSFKGYLREYWAEESFYVREREVV